MSLTNQNDILGDAVGTKSIPGITSLPSKHHYHPKAGFVQCVMKREMPSNRFSASKVSFALQFADGSEKTVLVAEKESAHGYSIYEISNEKKVGTMVRCNAGFSSIAYGIFDDQGSQISSVCYTVPSALKVIREAPARQAQIVLLSKKKIDLNDNSCSKTDPKTFEQMCQESIRATGFLSSLLENEQIKDSVNLYQSKKPYAKSEGRMGLNFKGRGRLASSKNMQLVSNSSKGMVVMCQIAKWNDNVFNVDFVNPFTLLHAFGFGLAQLDL